MSEENKTPMSEETYKAGREAFYNAYLVKIDELKNEYATSNCPYKEGDIIEDHIGKGMWNGEYEVYSSGRNSMPEMMYNCRVLKKDGTPTKREEYRQIYSSNILIKK